MTITLDTVLTVAIGRNTQDGSPMGDLTWQAFQDRVIELVEDHGGTIVCHALSVSAVGSDGVNEGQDEESAVFIVVNPTAEQLLRQRLGTVLGQYGQTSACFSSDHFHEPVFAGTTDGYRPRLHETLYTELEAIATRSTREEYASLEEALNDGFARRTDG